MSKVEKFIVTVLILTLITSFSIYGAWEDKMTFLSLLIPLIYAALALWAVGALRRQKSKVSSQRSDSHLLISDLRSPTSFSKVPTSHSPQLTAHSIPPGGGMLLLFWLYSAVMIPFSAVPYDAKISVLRFGCYLGAYWACANILSRFPRRRVVWGVLLVALLSVALYSLVQHKVNYEMLFGRLRYTNYGERLGGTYICPNHIAHLFQMWIPFCLVFLFIPQLGWFWRICFGYALPVFGLLIYQTQSRAGLLGMMASLGILLFLLMLRKSRRAFRIALVAAPLFVAVAFGGLWAGSSMFRSRMLPAVKVVESCLEGDWERAVSLDFRPQTWADSLLVIKERPLTGFGPGSYEQTFYKYRQRVSGNRLEIDHPHNELIELMAEYGLIGTILIIWAFISVTVVLVRFIKTADRPYHALPAAAFLAALAGTAVHGFFDFELRIFPNALMLSVLAGSAVAPLVRQSAERMEQGEKKSGCNRLNAVFRSLFSVLCILSALWAAQVMTSAMLRVRGDKFAADKDRLRAEKMYKAASTIDPQNWHAFFGLGQIYSYYRYQELDPALKKEKALLERDTFAKAFRCNDKKEEVVYGLGRAELMVGNRTAGLEYLRRAAERKRFNDFYWRKLGIERRKAGLYDEALDAFLHARKLNRSNETVNYNIQWLEKKLEEM